MPDPRALLAVLLLAATVLVAGCGGSTRDGGASAAADENHGYRGIYLTKPYDVPPVALTDDRGRPATLSQEHGLTLVFFGYTHCPDVCQTVMSTLASAVTRLPSGDRAKVAVDFVTTDPARDTTAVLRRYLDRFDPSFRGLTGPLPRLSALGAPLGVSFEKGKKLASGGYDVAHGANVVAVRDGKGLVVWTPATSPGDVTADLTRLLEDRS